MSNPKAYFSRVGIPEEWEPPQYTTVARVVAENNVLCARILKLESALERVAGGLCYVSFRRADLKSCLDFHPEDLCSACVARQALVECEDPDCYEPLSHPRHGRE
mgnify:CR=1 FL=1